MPGRNWGLRKKGNLSISLNESWRYRKRVIGRDGKVKSSGCKTRPAPDGSQGARLLKYGETDEGTEKGVFLTTHAFSH